MEEKLLDIAYRKNVIAEIKGNENVQRKIVSYKKQNMQDDNFYQYVVEKLEEKLDCQTVREMTVFATVNLQKRISKSEAGLYRKSPKRIFLDGDEVTEDPAPIYKAMGVDDVMRYANEAYKYQGQCALQVYVDDGCMKTRVLLPHHFDVICDPKNPERPVVWIISNFDNTTRDRVGTQDNNGYSQGNKYRDQVNQAIADYDDQKAAKERYYVWSNSYNFVMDGNGKLLDKETETVIIESIDESNQYQIASPLKDHECTPFIDVSHRKNFEFWLRGYDSLFDATVLYNTILTSEFSTVEMQGHAQAYYKGPADHMPENLRVGPDKVIHIPIDPSNPTDAEFGFANPGSDLGGIKNFRESFISSFLSSRGMDASVISGDPTIKASASGVDRLLKMVEEFDSSQEDMAMFQCVEDKLLYVIYATSKAYEEELEEEFVTGSEFTEETKVNVIYSGPEMIRTQMERLEETQKEIEMGLSSRVHALMELKGMTLEEAKNRIKEIDELEGLTAVNNEG